MDILLHTVLTQLAVEGKKGCHPNALWKIVGDFQHAEGTYQHGSPMNLNDNPTLQELVWEMLCKDVGSSSLQFYLEPSSTAGSSSSSTASKSKAGSSKKESAAPLLPSSSMAFRANKEDFSALEVPKEYVLLDRNTLSTLSQALFKYGYKMRLVADITLRKAILLGNRDIPLGFNTIMDFPILELIAQSRTNGILQVDLSNMLGIGSQTLSLRLKHLTSFQLITRMGMVDRQTKARTNLCYLTKFTPDFSEEVVMNFTDGVSREAHTNIRNEIISILKKTPNGVILATDLRSELKFHLKNTMEKKLYNRDLGVLVELGCVDKFLDGNSQVCVKYLQDYVPKEQNEMEEEIVEYTSFKRLLDVPLDQQIYEMICEAGSDGISAKAINEKLGIGSKYLYKQCELFTKSGLIRSDTKESVGRSRQIVYIAVHHVGQSKMFLAWKEDIAKKNRLLGIDSIMPTIPSKPFSAAATSSTKVAENGNSGVENLLLMEKPEETKEEEVPELRPTGAQLLQTVQRRHILYDWIEAKRVIMFERRAIARLFEQEEGEKHKIDRKTVNRIVEGMIKDGMIKMFQVEVEYVSGQVSMQNILVHRDIEDVDDPAITTLLEQIKNEPTRRGKEDLRQEDHIVIEPIKQPSDSEGEDQEITVKPTLKRRRAAKPKAEEAKRAKISDKDKEKEKDMDDFLLSGRRRGMKPVLDEQHVLTLTLDEPVTPTLHDVKNLLKIISANRDDSMLNYKTLLESTFGAEQIIAGRQELLRTNILQKKAETEGTYQLTDKYYNILNGTFPPGFEEDALSFYNELSNMVSDQDMSHLMSGGEVAAFCAAVLDDKITISSHFVENEIPIDTRLKSTTRSGINLVTDKIVDLIFHPKKDTKIAPIAKWDIYLSDFPELIPSNKLIWHPWMTVHRTLNKEVLHDYLKCVNQVVVHRPGIEQNAVLNRLNLILNYRELQITLNILEKQKCLRKYALPKKSYKSSGSNGSSSNSNGNDATNFLVYWFPTYNFFTKLG